MREGPADFRRKGKHYLATSSTTSYYPSPSEIAVAEMYHGSFTELAIAPDMPGLSSREVLRGQCAVGRHSNFVVIGLTVHLFRS